MNVDLSQMGVVLAIVVICYLVGMAAKVSNHCPDKAIPVVVGVAGGLLGVVGMYVIADFPAQDILNAIAIGIVSGLASTGIDQAYKQQKKG
jgi:ribonucleotide monophosphatase NagD (HAD superfamily)